MNKTEFLKELESRIRVLEKTEIKDILAEYSQHIDMKMENGLNEADAIKDFGNMDDLAAEILEAYHVNPEYESEGVQSTEVIIKPKRKNMLAVLGDVIKKAIRSAGRALKWIKRHFIGIFIIIGTFIKKLFAKKEKPEMSPEEIRAAEIKREEKIKSGELKRLNRTQKTDKAKGRCRKMVAGLLFACLAVIVVLCLIPVTIAVLASIFGLGLSTVLLIQGYPIIGILIGCIGCAIMGVSLWLLLVSLISRKGGNKPEEKDEDDDEFEMENAIDVVEEGDER